MKESHPVETAEFSIARGIHKEAAFDWWVPYTIRKRDVILSLVKKRGQESHTQVRHRITDERC